MRKDSTKRTYKKSEPGETSNTHREVFEEEVVVAERQAYLD